jgi:transposase-like protein
MVWFMSDLEYRRISAFIIDEIIIQIKDHHFWLWICTKPVDKCVLRIYILKEKHFATENLIHSLVDK